MHRRGDRYDEKGRDDECADGSGGDGNGHRGQYGKDEVDETDRNARERSGFLVEGNIEKLLIKEEKDQKHDARKNRDDDELEGIDSDDAAEKETIEVARVLNKAR